MTRKIWQLSKEENLKLLSGLSQKQKVFIIQNSVAKIHQLASTTYRVVVNQNHQNSCRTCPNGIPERSHRDCRSTGRSM